MTPDKDDAIRNADDLRKLLDDAGLPNIPIFEVKDMENPTSEEMQKIVEAIRNLGDGTAQ